MKSSSNPRLIREISRTEPPNHLSCPHIMDIITLMICIRGMKHDHQTYFWFKSCKRATRAYHLRIWADVASHPKSRFWDHLPRHEQSPHAACPPQLRAMFSARSAKPTKSSSSSPLSFFSSSLNALAKAGRFSSPSAGSLDWSVGNILDADVLSLWKLNFVLWNIMVAVVPPVGYSAWVNHPNQSDFSPRIFNNSIDIFLGYCGYHIFTLLGFDASSARLSHVIDLM